MRIQVPPKNLVDRVVEYFDPVRARNRRVARVQMAASEKWFGASKSRRSLAGWNPGSGSADEDTLDDLPILRDRSHALQRENPLALGATNTNVTSIVGTGLAPHPTPDAKALKITPEAALEWAETTKRKFNVWACSATECDLEATLDFYAQQPLVFRSALDSGDCFATLPWKKRPNNAYALKIAVVEAHRVCNKDDVPDTMTLTAGVEKDVFGAPINYHICKSHPGDTRKGFTAKEWDVVPAFGARTGRRNVIHLYDKRRPGQTRGVPYLAPVIEMLKQISTYTHSELQAAVVASMFTVFVKTESGTGLDLDEDGAPVSSAQGSGSDVKLSPGAIIDLAKNESIETADPGRPNQAADVFLQAMFRQLGTAIELPYEILVKHFTASYSAARAALLEAWRFFRTRRAWLASTFCQPVYEAWLEEAVANGHIVAQGFFDDPSIRAAWARAEWVGDGPGQIDPLKEVLAAKERIELTISNHSIETMESRGMSWRDVHDGLARERQLQRQSGTVIEQSDFKEVNDEPVESDEPEEPGSDKDKPEDAGRIQNQVPSRIDPVAYLIGSSPTPEALGTDLEDR